LLLQNEEEQHLSQNDRLEAVKYASALKIIHYFAEQGVLLLNSAFTVFKGFPASHSKDSFGWQEFSDAVIRTVNEYAIQHNRRLVFILWGQFAAKKVESAGIDSSFHCILKSAHPSPFSAHKGFFGNGHFRLCNEKLAEFDDSLPPIQWLLNEDNDRPKTALARGECNIKGVYDFVKPQEGEEDPSVVIVEEDKQVENNSSRKRLRIE